MQINRNMSAVMTNNQLLRTENKLAASMERLSSGLKINQASDNPAGIAISNKMKAQIDALDQAESNASDAISVLQIADGALNEVSSILQRMRELSVQAANGTNSYSDRQSIQAEIDELKKEVDRISSDTEYNTKALLDGSSDVRVYGENASRYMVSDAVPAQMYHMNVEAAAEQATVEMSLAVPAADGTITINGVAVNVSSGMTQDMYVQEIRNAAAEAGCSVEIDEVTSKLYVKSNYYGYNESIQFSMSKELAEAVALRDNTDCTYVVNEAAMTFDKAVATVAGKISIAGVEIEVEAGNTMEDYYDEIKAAAEKAGYATTLDANNNLVVRSEKAGKAELIEFSITDDLAEALNVIGTYAGEYQVNTAGVDAVVTIPKTQNADPNGAFDADVLKNTGFTSTTTVDVDGNRVVITDNNGFSIDFLLDEGFPKTPVAPTEEGNFSIEVTDIGSMTVQIGGNEHQDMDVRISEVSAASLYVDTVDVAVVKGADRAMVTLDGAISTLSATRSRIGAFQNRLEYANSSLAATNENMTAAYSGLLDTDMAEEMTEYTQQNILSQAAISVLSQANELPQQVLSLLQ